MYLDVVFFQTNFLFFSFGQDDESPEPRKKNELPDVFVGTESKVENFKFFFLKSKMMIIIMMMMTTIMIDHMVLFDLIMTIFFLWLCEKQIFHFLHYLGNL